MIYMPKRGNKKVLSRQVKLFGSIFNRDFNLGFHVPLKDRCDFCSVFEISSEEEKNSMKDNFQRHNREKDLVRNNKNQAKETAKIKDHETVIYFEQPHTRLNLARTITESLALITCLCMSYNQGKLIATSGIKVRHLVGQMRLLHVFSSI